MLISDAQRDMRRAYVGGGPGAMVSALVWLIAAVVERSHGVGVAFTVLFVGGMLIFPISKFFAQMVFRRVGEARENPLGATALESTIAMIGGLLAAWLFLQFKPAFVFPLAAIAVGTHYAVFRTVYGDRLFWVLAAILTAIGMVAVFGMSVPGGTIWCVAIAESIIGVILTVRATRSESVSPS